MVFCILFNAVVFQLKAQQALSLRVLIQGFFVETYSPTFPQMQQSTSYQIGITGPLSNISFNSFTTDEITIELHESTTPYSLVSTVYELLNYDGYVSCYFPSVANDDYYIVVKHRNSIETWSKYPITFNTTTAYDFVTSLGQAYGDNQISQGVYNFSTIYSGDINQDGAIDATDFLLQDADIQAFATGYMATDLNADGTVDANDFTILDPNIQNFVTFAKP